MKNILFLCLLFCFYSQAYAQIKYSKVNDFEVVKNSKKRKKLRKSWEKATSNDIYQGYKLLGESKSLLFLAPLEDEGEQIASYRTGARISTKIRHYRNTSPFVFHCYAFDKNSLELKFAIRLDFKMLSMSNPEVLDSHIDYENDNIHIFYRKREKTVLRYYHQVNDNPSKVIKELDYIFESKMSVNPPYPSIITSFSRNSFVFGFTKNSKSYTNYIYDQEMKLKETVEVKLPVEPIEAPRGLIEKSLFYRSTGAFTMFYDNENSSIYYVGKNTSNENNEHLNAFKYDIKREKLHQHKIALKKLGYQQQKKKGIIASNTHYPTIQFFFKNQKFYLVGATPLEGVGKYERLATEVIYHQFDDDFNLIVSDRMAVSDDIWEVFDKKNKKFKRKKSEYDLKITTNGDQFYIALNLKTPKTYTNTTDGSNGRSTSTGVTWEYLAGEVVFSIKNNKLQTPLAFHSNFRKDNKSYYFYIGEQTYRIKSGKSFELYKVNGDEEVKITSEKSDIRINRAFIYGNSNYILLPSKEGFIKVEL